MYLNPTNQRLLLITVDFMHLKMVETEFLLQSLMIIITCYLLVSPALLDQVKRVIIKSMRMWQKKVAKEYPVSSKRTHRTVTPPRIPPDNVLFFHDNMSATTKGTKHTALEKWISDHMNKLRGRYVHESPFPRPRTACMSLLMIVLDATTLI